MDSPQSPSTRPYLQDIPDNETAKRAVEVALAGGHSIAFIYQQGAPGMELLQAAEGMAKGAGIPFKGLAALSCPCGFYGAMTSPCTCSLRRIMGHWRRLAKRVAGFDMAIEVLPPWVKVPRRGEDEERFVERVRRARAFAGLSHGLGFVAGRFLYPDRAVAVLGAEAVNKYSGKWNHHYWRGPVDEAIADFERALRRVIGAEHGVTGTGVQQVRQSAHRQAAAGGETTHHEFLADASGDPRQPFVTSLPSALEGVESVLVYNRTFEDGRLAELRARFPQHATSIRGVRAKLVDLMTPFQRQWLYTPQMHGSYPIKAVLPALVPELTYGTDCGEGMDAWTPTRRHLRPLSTLRPG